MRGSELNIPSIVILKFVTPVSKLPPKSGTTFLLNKHMSMIAITMYMLKMKPNKDENLSELKVLGNEIGNESTNY